MARTIQVKVELLEERYYGTPTGRMVFHTSEHGCTSGIFRGCPLGRGYSEEESLRDFVFRANADDSSLKLKRDELEVVSRA